MTDNEVESAAFTTFLFGRMIGRAAEIDDHINRGRNMDTRTAASVHVCRLIRVFGGCFEAQPLFI